MPARFLNLCCHFAFACLLAISFEAKAAADGPNPNSFLVACQALYGQGSIDFRAAAQTKPPTDPNLATLKRTVDALLEASWIMIGSLPDETCETHLRVLLKAHGLELSSVDISDLRPLASFVQLEELTLSNDSIADLSPLSGLTNLRSLDIGGNRVSDLRPLSTLANLSELRALQNSISDLTPLSGLNHLFVLGLEANRITDVTPIAHLPVLLRLYLQGNQIVNANALSALPKIGNLNLNSNSIADISGLFPSLPAGVSWVFLNLSNNPIPQTQIQPLRDRNGGMSVKPGQVGPPGLFANDFTSPRYVVPAVDRGDEGFVNQVRTINICSQANDPVPRAAELHWPNDGRIDWPSCKDHGLGAP